MYISTNRSGATAWKSSVWVELPTSPSRTTRSGRWPASQASASPKALLRGDRPRRRQARASAAAPRGLSGLTSGGEAGVIVSDRMPPSSSIACAACSARHRLAVPSLVVRDERDAVTLLGARDDHRRASVADRLASRRRRSPRRRGRRSRSCASRTPGPAGRTGRRSSRASWGRAARGGSCPGSRPGRRPRGTRPPPSPPRPSPRPPPSRRAAPNARAAGAVEPHRERHAEPDREALAQRAGRDVDPRAAPAPARGGLGSATRTAAASSSSSSEIAPIALRVAYRAGAACPFDITNRSFAGRLRVLHVEAEMVRVQHGEQVGAGHRRRRVPGSAPRSCSGCCRRRSARRGRSRAGCGRPSSPPVTGGRRVPASDAPGVQRSFDAVAARPSLRS